MDHPDDFLTAPAGVKIEQPQDQEKLALGYVILLFLSFFFILMTHFLLILEGTGRSLPTFLRFPIA